LAERLVEKIDGVGSSSLVELTGEVRGLMGKTCVGDTFWSGTCRPEAAG
jgi:hypothetical protein